METRRSAVPQGAQRSSGRLGVPQVQRHPVRPRKVTGAVPAPAPSARASRSSRRTRSSTYLLVQSEKLTHPFMPPPERRRGCGVPEMASTADAVSARASATWVLDPQLPRPALARRARARARFRSRAPRRCCRWGSCTGWQDVTRAPSWRAHPRRLAGAAPSTRAQLWRVRHSDVTVR